MKGSVVSIGAFGIGGGLTWSDTTIDIKGTSDLLDAALDIGVNMIDTAPVYGIGASEIILGEALKGKRDKFILQTKCALNWRGDSEALEYVRDGKTVCRDLSAKAVRADLEDCLERLQTDYIDIFITHRQSEIVSVEETMGELMKMLKEGKIRAVGISNASPERLRDYEKIGQVALAQEKLSLLAQDNLKDYLPLCEEIGTTFQAFSTLQAGSLTGLQAIGRTFPQGDFRNNFKWYSEDARPHMEAMYKSWEPLIEKYNCSYSNLVQAWVLAQSPVINLLTGFRRIDSLRDTAKVVDITMDKADIAKMRADADKLLAL
jgi:methylglyoxal reductase